MIKNIDWEAKLKTRNVWVWLLLVVTILAFVDAVYLTYHHYEINILSPDKPSFCSINEMIDCDGVARSAYAEVFGIATASVGIFAYFFLMLVFVLSLLFRKNKVVEYIIFCFPVMLVMGLVSLHQAVLSLVVIQALCLMCLLLYFCIFFMIVFAKLASPVPLMKILVNFPDYLVSLFNPKKRLRTDALFFLAVFILSIFVAVFFDMSFQTYFKTRLSAQSQDLARRARFDQRNVESFLDYFYSLPKSDIDLQDTPFKGALKAPFIFVEFSDFQCPFCSDRARQLVDLMQEYDGLVALYFKHYPLDTHCNSNITRPFHEQACEAATYSACAYKQQKFWEYHNYLFENQRNLSPDFFVDSIKHFSFNRAVFEQCLRGPGKRIVERDMALAHQLEISYTPTVYLNGRRISDAKQFETISSIRKLLDGLIKEALSSDE